MCFSYNIFSLKMCFIKCVFDGVYLCSIVPCERKNGIKNTFLWKNNHLKMPNGEGVFTLMDKLSDFTIFLSLSAISAFSLPNYFFRRKDFFWRKRYRILPQKIGKKNIISFLFFRIFFRDNSISKGSQK